MLSRADPLGGLRRRVPARQQAHAERAVRDHEPVVRLRVGDEVGVGLARRPGCTAPGSTAPASRAPASAARQRASEKLLTPTSVTTPGVLQAAHALHLLRDRHDRVGPVDLVEVDHVDAEPSRALAAVLLDVAGGRRDREHLRRDERFLASIAERRGRRCARSCRGRRSPRCRSRSHRGRARARRMRPASTSAYSVP